MRGGLASAPPKQPAPLPPQQGDPQMQQQPAEGGEGEQPAGEEQLDIVFIVLPEGFTHHVFFAPSVPCVYLYNTLVRDLKIERSIMRIVWKGRTLSDTDVLNQVVDVMPGVNQITLNLEFEFGCPKHLAQANQGENVVNALEIKVGYGEDVPQRTVIVTVVRDFLRKQFIGGFRNKNTGSIYHHCASQTEAAKKAPKPKPPIFSRVTQTAGVTRSQQSKREAFTQMARPDLYLDTSKDIWIKPKPYFSAKQLHDLRTEKCIKLQAHMRGFFARRLAKRMRADEDLSKEELAAEQERRRQQHEERKRREIERRTNPRTQADFNLLLNEVEAWKLQEITQIKESKLDKEAQQIAFEEVLRKELRLLETIQKLQQKASKENRKSKISATLNAMAGHKNWEASDGTTTVVETPFTVRAKELMDLYNGLQLKGISTDERLDILLHVKWTVKEFDCPLTREIVELVDREADLLNRSRPTKTLGNLRQRMSNLFLQFIETPEFNPEAINHQRVPLEFTQRPLVKLDAKKK